MSKNILITGASGFIGSFLVEESLQKGFHTFAAIRSSSSHDYLKDPAINFIELDLLNPAQMDLALAQFQKEFHHFDYVIHTAGLTKSVRPANFEKVNFLGTQNLVEALKRNQLVPSKFVYISSLAAYGPGDSNLPIQPQHKKQPITAYGISKLKTEEYLFGLLDFPFVIVNPTAVYGPRDKDFFFVIESIQKGIELYVGNKNQLLSFVHVSDLVQAIFLAMHSPLTNVNLLVSDLAIYDSQEMNQIIKAELGVKTFPMVVPAWLATVTAMIAEQYGRMVNKAPLLNRDRLREYSASNWGVDGSAIKALGYLPAFNFSRGIKDTIDWCKKNKWMQ